MTDLKGLQQRAAEQPEDLQAQLACGVALGNQGRYAAAEAAFRRGLAINPEHIEARLHLALVLMELRRLEEAAACCEFVLQQEPGSERANRLLGQVRILQQEYPAAIKHLRAALEVSRSPGNLTNLMYALGRSGCWEEAQSAFREALALAPADHRTYEKLARAYVGDNRLDDAVRILQAGLAAIPEQIELLSLLGFVQIDHDQVAAGEALFRRALASHPDHVPLYLGLGHALLAQGREAEAREAVRPLADLRPAELQHFGPAVRMLACLGLQAEGERLAEQWVQAAPDDPAARHFWAACRGDTVDARASADFLRREFDRFALTFDAVLSRLHYRAPELLQSALAELFPGESNRWEILDAGCGTGLCAASLRPYARRLIGVDLSAEMLDRARRRGLYDVLISAELVRFLANCPQAFDVIVAADTLVYFGELQGVLTQMAVALRPGGHLLFTAEAADEAGPDFRLNLNGRYAHRMEYVQRTLEACGFQVVALKPEILRTEALQPVVGLLAVARLPGQITPRDEEDFALYMMRKVADAQPDDPRAQFELGLLFTRFGRHAEAASRFQRVIALCPTVSAAHFNLGNAWFAQQEFAEAIAAYQQALDLEPDADTFNNLGNALASLSRWQEARQAYEQALRLDADFARARNNLARLATLEG